MELSEGLVWECGWVGGLGWVGGCVLCELCCVNTYVRMYVRR